MQTHPQTDITENNTTFASVVKKTEQRADSDITGN